ncbi:TetR/AcrR family transcriptional regulator [Longispora sp. NPDC051575]|uniref:TetR/AcrR family transcriptional regulator n=1 Tax=Longispora sp. NPDC051575 TaxID=3154943 RepID=UPI003438C75A
MTTPAQHRRERERAQRHQLIISSARELADAEGWDAVTTRRLADRIEYSQPVLYSHFADKGAIIDAVALQGFTELLEVLRSARAGRADADQLDAVAGAYLTFADEQPALYDAMFTLASDLPFGTPEAPSPLRAAFGELLAAFAVHAAGRDVHVLTEVGWSALHGLATLTRAHRLRPDLRDQRLPLLLDLLRA